MIFAALPLIDSREALPTEQAATLREVTGHTHRTHRSAGATKLTGAVLQIDQEGARYLAAVCSVDRSLNRCHVVQTYVLKLSAPGVSGDVKSNRTLSYLSRNREIKLCPDATAFRSASSIETITMPRSWYTFNCSRAA